VFLKREIKEEIFFKRLKTLTSQNIPKSALFRKKTMRGDNNEMVFFGHHNWTLVFLSFCEKYKTFLKNNSRF